MKGIVMFMSILKERLPQRLDELSEVVQDLALINFGFDPLADITSADIEKIVIALPGNTYEVRFLVAQEDWVNDPLAVAVVKELENGNFELSELDINYNDLVCNIEELTLKNIAVLQDNALTCPYKVDSLVIKNCGELRDEALNAHFTKVTIDFDKQVPTFGFDAVGFGHKDIYINGPTDELSVEVLENAINDTRTFEPQDTHISINGKSVSIEGSYPNCKLKVGEKEHQQNRDDDRTDILID
jgi:hypothetical protein